MTEVVDEKKEIYENPVVAEVPADLSELTPEQRGNIAVKLGMKAEEDHIAPRADIEYIYDKIIAMTSEEGLEVLRVAQEYHADDRNFPQETREKIDKLLKGHKEADMPEDEWDFDVRAEASIIKYHSPYPEVRSIADPYDDPTIPVETFRAYFLGVGWAIIGMGVNTFFNPRFPSISLSSSIIQILLYPCGLLLQCILPDWGFTIGGVRHTINPGPWTYKEQMFATITFDVAIGTTYVYSNFQVQKLSVFFNQSNISFGYEILLTLSNQCMGFGFAGLLRRFVVYPAKAMWPSLLPTLALSRALLVPDRKDESINGWTITRYRLFFYAFGAMFCYYWIPGFLFAAVSTFNWMTWIAPDNVNLAAVTGSVGGLGFNPIPSFDWLIISYSGPLYTPAFAFIQTYIGALMGAFVILGVWYGRKKWTNFLPINTSDIFANDGTSYDVTRVVNAKSQLDEQLYQNYSPPFYSAANLVVYGAFFAFYPLNFIYSTFDSWGLMRDAFISFYRDMVFDFKYGLTRSFKIAGAALTFNREKLSAAYNEELPNRPSAYSGYNDAHSVMMQKYPEAPDWWFLVVFIISFVFAILCVTIYPIETPVWVVFFVIGLNAVWVIPMTTVAAVTSITEGLNVVTELIIGYALPGNAQALMFAKAYGYNISGQADNYITDQKMAHYSKVPPRALFRGQIISTILTCFVCIGVMDWQFSNIKGLCTPDQASKFNCEDGSVVYYASAVMWGTIGPKRVFSQLYPELKYCFLIGALVAVFFLTVQRGGPKFRAYAQQRYSEQTFRILDKTVFKLVTLLRYAHPTVICNGFLSFAPTNLTYVTAGVYVNWAFMYYIKRRYTAWWEKYTYVLSASLDGAIAFSALIIFFAVQYNPVNLSWWGNNVPYEGIDAFGPVLDVLPPNTTFGPAIGSFH